MSIGRLLQSLKGQCRYCGKPADLLKRDHPECQQTHQGGFQEGEERTGNPWAPGDIVCPPQSHKESGKGELILTTSTEGPIVMQMVGSPSSDD